MNGARKGILTLGLGIVGIVSLNAAQAASFDCAKAHSKVEKLICHDPVISRLDSQLGKAYKVDLAKADSKQKKRLVTDELNWLKNMRDLCTTQTCFKHAYWQRLAELKTFYMPHSSMYGKASDKAALIQKILRTVPLYPTKPSKTKKCRGIFKALKKRKGVEFINPVVQVMSYANPKLVPFRQKLAKLDKSNYPQKAPLTFNYDCEPNISGSWDNASNHDALKYCKAYYGLPPFKLYEIPWGKEFPHKIRHIFYFDAEYGPMNRGTQRYWISGGTFLQNFFHNNKHEFHAFFTASPGSGFEPNYNSLIKYKGAYYILLIYKPSSYKANPSAWWLRIDFIRNKNSCMWFPVKSRNSN